MRLSGHLEPQLLARGCFAATAQRAPRDLSGRVKRRPLPPAAQACPGDVELFGSGEYPGGETSVRPLIFNWQVSSDACRGIGCSLAGSWRPWALNIELNKQRGEQNIFVPKEAFGAVTLSKTYRFSLTVTDFLGNSIGKQRVKLDGLTGLKPAVSTDAGQRVQGINYNTSLTISADATLPTCIEGGDVAPTWSWTILKIRGKPPSDDAPSLLSAEVMTRHCARPFPYRQSAPCRRRAPPSPPPSS